MSVTDPIYNFEKGILSKALDFGSLASGAGFDHENLDSIFNILPVIRIQDEHEQGVIRITGFWAKRLAADIERVWKSKRITNGLFIELNSRSFTIHKFFALEVWFIMDTLMQSPKVYTDTMTLQSIRDKLRTGTWLKDADGSDEHESRINLKNLKRIKATPLPHQLSWVKDIDRKTKGLHLSGLLAFHDPGTGKTWTGIMTSLVVDADMTLIVSPKNAVDYEAEVWEKTIVDGFKKPVKYWKSTSGTMPKGDEEFLICHYGFLKKLLPLIKMFKKKKRFCIWVDESHNFNELSAARTRILIDISRESGAYLTNFASGTPFKMLGSEVVPILRMIDPLFTPGAEKAFLGIFGATKGRALDILARRIGRVRHRVEKKSVVDVAKNYIEHKIIIPDPTPYLVETVKQDITQFVRDRVVYYSDKLQEYEFKFRGYWARYYQTVKPGPDKQAADTYLQFVNKMHKRFNMDDDIDKMKYCKNYEKNNILPFLPAPERKEFKHVVAVYKYLILVIRGEALGRVLLRRRVECFKAMVRHAALEQFVKRSRKKTLIFSSYVAVVNEINDHLKDKGFDPAVVTGETNSDFERIIGKFKTSPDVNPAIATYPSLSTAVPVTEASTIIMMDLPYREYIRDQAISRLDRKGQDGPVVVVTCILDTGLEDNLSTRTEDILETSKIMVDRMLGLKGTGDLENEDV